MSLALQAIKDPDFADGEYPVAKEAILELEDFLAAQTSMPRVDMETRHSFADGLYAREMRMPRGVVATGRQHKKSHFNFLMTGKIRVLADGVMRTMTAPCMVFSPAGVKKAAYCLEDCVWIVVEATTKTNLKDLEEELVEENRPGVDEAMRRAVKLNGFDLAGALNRLEEN